MQVTAAEPSSPDTVRFNLDGKVYEARKKVGILPFGTLPSTNLSKYESMLSTIVTTDVAVDRNSEGHIVFQRDSELFRYVLRPVQCTGHCTALFCNRMQKLGRSTFFGILPMWSFFLPDMRQDYHIGRPNLLLLWVDGVIGPFKITVC
jgi:hypothetical protein